MEGALRNPEIASDEDAPRWSPWGKPDKAERIAEGIWFVSSPSHGGFHISKDRNAKVPMVVRAMTSRHGLGFSGWYEEDVDWTIVAIVHRDVFPAEKVEEAVKILRAAKPDAVNELIKAGFLEG
jgi:hypothetical protein